ncbi:MAG: hypothetical protein J6A03_09380 [Lachnospiraceae bacterium]|nr:hypothetical protein [Lachnospiraceae bacterium]
MKRWNNAYMKKVMTWVLCCSLIGTVCVPGRTVHATATTQATTENTNIDANGTLGKNSDVGIEVTKSITGAIGKSVKVAFNLKSSNADTIKLKSVYPVIDTAFPFETSGDAYKIITANGDASKQSVLAAEYDMTARSDLETGYQSVKFIGEYTKIGADGTANDYYVIKTINIYFSATGVTTESTKKDKTTSKSDSKKTTEDLSDDSDDYDDSDDTPSGGYSGYSGGGSDDVEAPKLIITGFDSDPEKIMAGQSFKITIHIQNSSKTTNVCNGKFLVGDEAGNFLPTSGSNAVFVEKIAAGETGDVEIELKTSAELAQKNYRLVVKGDFDDGNGNSFTASESVYVPVYQEVKLGITDVSMSPESIGIGSQGSLMFTVNNQSGAGIYNVKATAKDDAATSDECYIGNIAGNSSAYATLNVTGVADNSDTGTIKVVISYEDAEGNASEIEQDVACSVGVDSYEEYSEDYYDDEYSDDYSEGLPWWVYLIIALVVVVVIVVIVIIVIRKRKKKMAALLEAEDDEWAENGFADEVPDAAVSEAVADKEQDDVQDPTDELVSVSDGLLQEDNDVIEVEGNDTQNITDGEDDTEDEDF